MGKFAGGFVLAAALAAAVHFSGILQPSAEPCAGICGEGTACIDERCQLESSDEEVSEEAVAEPKRKRRRRRGKSGVASESEHGGEEGIAAFVPVDDSRVPRFNRGASKTIDLDAGSERLSDRVVNQELAKLDRRFQRCVSTAANYTEDPIRGTLRYELGISGSGKVTGVNVNAPKSLQVFGIVPCVRKAIHGHRFPSFDGPTMGVEGSFQVD
jgi:hypothetical protein